MDSLFASHIATIDAVDTRVRLEWLEEQFEQMAPPFEWSDDVPEFDEPAEPWPHPLYD